MVVCEYCHSVLARTDRMIDDLGRVAELMETGSPLQLGLRGAYQGVSFEITGRTQLGHEAGGMWDEWYAYFSNGRWGWLAEAQGRFYLTFEKQLPQQSLIPPFGAIAPGQPLAPIPGSVTLTVAETGLATSLSAAGEIPWKFAPGERYEYVDLSGPRGEFATLDYSADKPLLFIGREVTLTDLGLANAVAPARKAQRIDAARLNCPKCGGRLDLRAPDQTQRIGCPNCASLLDVNQGQLKFLAALRKPQTEPAIPIGAVGNFPIGKLTNIGFLVRSVTFEGVKYTWEEYLLYEPKLGFRWLVRSDDHWSLVETLAPGIVQESGGEVGSAGKGGRIHDRAFYDNQEFKIFQNAQARVEFVQGECYWKVTAGETVRAVDYIHPPLFLSKEISQYGQSAEINWSVGTYLQRAEVEQAFGLKTPLPAPTNVAPNQPFPHKGFYRFWGLALLATFLLGMFAMITGARQEVFKTTLQLEPRTKADDTQTFFSDPFELRARRNLKVSAYAPLDNTWVYLEGDVINEETGEVQPFALPVEYYSGVDGGESWSEGNRSPGLHLSSLPAGRYTLRIEAQWERWQQPQMVTVSIVQGVPRLLYWILALIAVSLIPIMVAIRQFSFETRRWADSEFNPYQSSSE